MCNSNKLLTIIVLQVRRMVDGIMSLSWKAAHDSRNSLQPKSAPNMTYCQDLTFRRIHQAWSQNSSAREPFDSHPFCSVVFGRGKIDSSCHARRQTVSSPPSFSAPGSIEFSTRAEGHACECRLLALPLHIITSLAIYLKMELHIGY